MKKFAALILLTSLILSLAACGGKGEVTYKTDVPVAAIGEAVNAALENGSEMVEVPETYINHIMDVDTANFEEFKVYKQVVGAVVDEYGIFKVKDTAGIDTAIAALNAYIEVNRTSSMVIEYMPEEMPKLDAAEARAMGEYVVFCILSEDSKADFFGAVSDILTEK